MEENNDDKNLDNYPENVKQKILERREQLNHERTERERYVNAIEGFKLFKKDRSYFWHFLLNQDKEKVEDMVYLAQKPIEPNLKHTDYPLYSFLKDVLSTFIHAGHHRKNYNRLFKYMERNKKNNNENKINKSNNNSQDS